MGDLVPGPDLFPEAGYVLGQVHIVRFFYFWGNSGRLKGIITYSQTIFEHQLVDITDLWIDDDWKAGFQIGKELSGH